MGVSAEGESKMGVDNIFLLIFLSLYQDLPHLSSRRFTAKTAAAVVSKLFLGTCKSREQSLVITREYSFLCPYIAIQV